VCELLDFEIQYFYLITSMLSMHTFFIPIYIYIYIYILGLRAIAIKYIKANYFDFLFLIANIVLFYLLFLYMYNLYAMKLLDNIYGFIYLLIIIIASINILFSIILLIKHFLINKYNNLTLFSIINNKKNIFKYYPLYVILFIIFYELMYFQNLYTNNTSSHYGNDVYNIYISILYIYLFIIPTIIIFLYVMEKNNVINANYLLLKDKLLKKSWLTTKPFILLTLSMVFIIIASLLLLPGIGYFVYLIHTYLFGITPDIMRLEGP